LIECDNVQHNDVADAGTFFAALSSTVATLPPNTGHCANVANFRIL